MNIAAVSKKYEVSSDTIRYYERIGLIPPITRNQQGYRDFSEKDLNWVYFAKVMRNAGVSIEALIEYVALFREGREESMAARQEILLEERDKLVNKIEELQETLAYLDVKLANNSSHLAACEKNLEEGK